MKRSFLYIVTNDYNSVLYVGVTTDLVKRIYQHKKHEVDGFTARYNIHKLVYFEEHSLVVDAIQREKRIKKWERKWKIDLINAFNPGWRDLYADIGW